MKTRDVASQVDTNTGHISRHRNRENPAPYPVEKVTLAFGNLAQPVLVKKMQSDDVRIVRNALGAVCRLFKVPLNVVKSVKAGGVRVLTKLAQDADLLVRQRSTKALELMCNCSNGKAAVVKENVLPDLAAVLDDDDVEVRRNIFSAFVNLSANVDGAEALVECGYVKLLVGKAGNDADEAVQVMALVVLNKCTNVIGGRGLSDSLAHGAARCCIALLAHKSAEVRHLAALNIASLAFSPEGKVQAIRGDGVPTLLELMRDGDDRVRASAAAAMMGIVTDDSGKEAVIEEGVESLVTCLMDSTTLVVLNTLKCVSTVAAHPKARKLLNDADVVPLIQTIYDDGIGALRPSAKTAIAAVTWTP